MKGPGTDPAPHQDNWAAIFEALMVQACRETQGCLLEADMMQGLEAGLPLYL